jgi:hypothetical protein
MTNKIEQLKIAELKSRLCQAAKKSQQTMAPMLYYLRQKIKSQGKAGQGFGQWIEAHLDITRRTADRWADEWAIAQGLKTPATSRQKTKGGPGESGRIIEGPGKVYCNLTLLVTEFEQDELLFAWGLLGDEEATRLICDTMKHAAKAKEDAPKEAFPVELGELQEVGAKRPSQPVRVIASRLTLADGESL